MKFKLGAALVFFSFLLLPGIAMGHPLKLSASLIEYNPDTKSLRMECKVFRDDFERSLHRTVLKGINPATIKQDEKSKIIDSFFKNFYTIALNGKVLPLKLEASKHLTGHNVLVLRFAANKLKLRKGDKLKITNTLFFQDFGYAQSNRIAVRIPPFSIDDHHVATFANFEFLFTL
jgi:hypothetical protein